MPSTTEDGPVRLEAEVPADVAERFRIAAREADRSTRAHLRHLIRDHVNDGAPATLPGLRKPSTAEQGRHGQST